MTDASLESGPFVGPDGKLTARGQALVADNIALGAAVAKKYAALYGVRDRNAVEDIRAEAYLGLCRAAATFDPSRAKFATHGTWGARGRVTDHMRRRPGDRRRSIEDLAGGPESVADGSAGPDEALDASDDPRVGRLLAAIERLPDRHREMLRLHLQGVALARIGASFGVTKERARQLVARAKEMVFRALRAGGDS